MQRTPPLSRRPRSSHSDHTVSSGDGSPIRKPRPHSIAGRMPSYASHTVSSQLRIGRSAEKTETPGKITTIANTNLLALCISFKKQERQDVVHNYYYHHYFSTISTTREEPVEGRRVGKPPKGNQLLATCPQQVDTHLVGSTCTVSPPGGLIEHPLMTSSLLVV